MATYFLRSKHFSRGKGSRVTRAAAYRAGERIRDERTGEAYNYSDRHDVAYKEVVLPADLAGRPEMAWTQDRATLWNAAEHAGRRCNSRLARELLVLVPPELTPGQRARLVRDFSQGLADRYRCAVDVVLHTPRPGADRRNHHAHLLMTVREVTPDGLGSRTSLELGGRERHQRGMGSAKEEYLSIRQRWAEHTNEALQRAGLAARVDHRSFKAQGLDREPTPTVPEKVFYAERGSGAGTIAGDAIRARHRERLAARLEGAEELERVVLRQKEQLRERAIADLSRKEAAPRKARWASLTREERNAVRRQQYRARREIEKRDPEREARRREVARQRYHESFRRDPEAMRQRRREYRKARVAEVNRSQREYRRANAEELNRKRREHRRAHAQEESRRQHEHPPTDARRSAGGIEETAPSPTPQESAQAWRAYRESSGPGKSPQQSAEDWKAFREHQPSGPTAEDAAREWLASRAGHAPSQSPPPSTRESSHPPQSTVAGEAEDQEDRNADRHRDYELQM